MNLRTDIPQFPVYFLVGVDEDKYEKPIEHLAYKIRENYPKIDLRIFGYKLTAESKEKCVYIDSPNYLGSDGRFTLYAQIRRYISIPSTPEMLKSAVSSMIKDSEESGHTILLVPYECTALTIKEVAKADFRGPVEIVSTPFNPGNYNAHEETDSLRKTTIGNVYKAMRDLANDQSIKRYPITVAINDDIAAIIEENERDKDSKPRNFDFIPHPSKNFEQTVKHMRRFLGEDYHLFGVRDILRQVQTLGGSD